MSAATVELLIQAGLLVAALVGGFVTIKTYIKTANIRRAEWLHTLYTSFYEETTYNEMRRILDYKGAKFDTLIQQLSDNTGEQHTLREDLVDYLNFFEFIATLWKTGQLETEEILMMFDYYIRCLNHNPVIRDYIRLHGFEGLNAMIAKAEAEFEKEHDATTSHLFVYGTLMSQAESEVHDILTRHATLIGPATFQGTMYLIERPDGSLEYPGVVPSPHPDDVVHGEIYRLDGPKEILPRLDEYEECAPTSPRPHEYRREVVDVRGPSGEAKRSFIYLYNRPTDHLPVLESGSFIEYKDSAHT